MPEYQCGNCREVSRLGPSARFCPYCGSSSLNFVIKEDMDVETAVKTLELLKEVVEPRRRKQVSE